LRLLNFTSGFFYFSSVLTENLPYIKSATNRLSRSREILSCFLVHMKTARPLFLTSHNEKILMLYLSHQMRSKWQRMIERTYPRLAASHSSSNNSSARHNYDRQLRDHNNQQNGQSGTSSQRGTGRINGPNRGGRGGLRPPSGGSAGQGHRSNNNSRVNPRPANAGPVAKVKLNSTL